MSVDIKPAGWLIGYQYDIIIMIHDSATNMLFI